MISSQKINRAVRRRLAPVLVLLAVLVGPARAAPHAAAQPPDRHGMEMRLAACATCHGKHGEGDMGSQGGIYPRLAGQRAEYLYHQMRRFTSEKRTGIPPVVIMQRLLENLSPPYLRLIAQYYKESSPPYPPRATTDPTQLQEGRDLARQGLPEKHIAACTGCHGTDLQGQPPNVPSLAGQYDRYLRIQFAHWEQGQRHNELHEHIAHTLTGEQIRALSTYLSWLRPTAQKDVK